VSAQTKGGGVSSQFFAILCGRLLWTHPDRGQANKASAPTAVDVKSGQAKDLNWYPAFRLAS